MHENWEPLSRVLGHYRAKIEKLGLRVEISSDFEKLSRCANDLKHPLTPMFSPKFNTFFRKEAFWLGVFEGEKCVGTLAFKQQPLGGETLADYTSRSLERYYGSGTKKQVRIDASEQPYLSSIDGTVAYCGEFFVEETWRKKGLSLLLASFGKPAVWTQWPEVELIYIFMQGVDAQKGLFANIKITRTIPVPLQWENPPRAEHDLQNLWLGAQNLTDFYGWLKAELRMLENLGASMSPSTESPSS